MSHLVLKASSVADDLGYVALADVAKASRKTRVTTASSAGTRLACWQGDGGSAPICTAKPVTPTSASPGPDP
jgi:hypothetical protein